MRKTLVTSLVLAFSFSALGGSALAQAEADPSPSTEPVASATPAAAAAEVAAEVATARPALLFMEPKWRKVAASKGPAAREDHTWTVDADGRFAYLFGGRDGGREFGDLWRYDLRRDSWKKLSPKGTRPQARFGHSAVWVDGRGVVVFAGQQGPDFFDDLWTFDPAKGRWKELPAKGSVPKRRYGSCMVVGPDGRLWISHGFTTSGRFDDTRAYNLKTGRWAVITPDGRLPGERCLHDCFTSARGELVLYGGQDDGAFALGDLWRMGREREWQRLEDPQPKPRRLYAVTEAADHAYVFGGAGEDNSALADLWRVDRETLAFERVRVEGNHPSARYAGTLITDAKRGRLLLFGGQGERARADVWELIDTAAPLESSAAPAEEPGDGGEEPLDQPPSAEPSALPRRRAPAATAEDPRSRGR